MGENEGLVDPGGPLPNGLLPGAGPIMMTVDAERWLKAEARTSELIACIQPNQLSEERRNAVADYVQRLIAKCFPCQVCTFGSVPLKTYLPDGDIDLTAFSHDQILKDTWANQVRDMLENEEKNDKAEFHVKEVQYIQAEVKIIKCLVENIVVDISFNQVGGLCTLCFLEEVDNLINQNHLFKRSIILIKAWCYYESRILGAHHGLISTYALETLVLYIFHVFNNSFHGPLEVLYRFLEFFSNFDWDNFCVSLWGPVRISSLPDVTAESPRKDSGELLLSKLFLDACSSVYAVFPGGQENNGQSFTSKHFNVVDPLRVSNNLGRSVSKGNSFRIRSAFAFGAKRLARLLECPKENLVSEVNQFFLNTWERHGRGHRPDAPGADHLKLSTSRSFNESETSKNHLSGKKVDENAVLHKMDVDSVQAHGVFHEISKISSRLMPARSEMSTDPHTQSSNSLLNQKNVQDTDQSGREHDVLNNQVHKDPKADSLINDIKGRFLFARAWSSPELTDNSRVSSQAQRNKLAEMENSHDPVVRLDTNNRRKLPGSEVNTRPTNRASMEDIPSSRHASAQLYPHSSAESLSNSNSNHYNRDFVLDSSGEDFSSTSVLPQQEEQDIVNLMASSSLHGFNNQIHAPYNLTSAHGPFPIPSSYLASMGYGQQNLSGFIPTNISFIDPSAANVQFPHGLVSHHMADYVPSMGLTSPSEDSVDQNSENLESVEMNSREFDDDIRHEHEVVGSSSNYELENRSSGIVQNDDQPPATSSGSKYIPPFRLSGTSNTTRFQHKHTRDRRGSFQENSDDYRNQDIRSSDAFAEERSTNSRFSSATHSSLRSRTPSENSWDGSSVNTPISSKEKRGKKILSSDIASTHGKGKSRERTSNQSVDDGQEWGSSLNMDTEIVERNPGSEQVPSLQIPRHHLSGFEVAQTSGSDSMMPFGPMLIGHGLRQGMNDNSGLIPFYPAGPPIPFVTVLPFYNIPSETGPCDASSGNLRGDETIDKSESGQNCNSEGYDQSDARGAGTVETPEELKSDILSSDFASHWQNLQFGRFCQNPRYNGPIVYPPPVMVPPVYLQGQFPYDNSNRPLSTNTNIFSQLMSSYGHRLIPMAPLPPVSSRPPHVYQRVMDDMPRYRSGTGTYLPNPKINVRDRHSSGAKRGNYNHERHDNYGDREGNWNAASSKSRNAARNHNRVQTDKSNSRTSESRADRPWSSYRQDSTTSYQAQNGPPRSKSNKDGPHNVTYNMYPFAATNPNGVSNGHSVSPVVMLYPLDHNAYGSLGEPLEFGSLGPLAFSGIREQSQLNEGNEAGTFSESMLHGSSEHLSSPEQPSSPHHRRRV